MMGLYSEKDENMQLKIESKKLHSGKCQVKFYFTGEAGRGVYGYTLVDSGTTLKDVVVQIKQKLSSISGYENYYQNHLFSLGKSNRIFSDNFVIFKN